LSLLDLKEMETVTLKKRKIVVSNAQLKKKAYPLIASIESPPSTNDDRASSSSRSCCGSPSFSGVTHCLSVSLSVCPWLFLSLHPIEAWGHYFVLEGPEEGVVALTSCTSLLTRPVFQLDWVRRGTSDLQKCGGFRPAIDCRRGRDQGGHGHRQGFIKETLLMSNRSWCWA